jgi:hypothetical protein
MKFRDAALLSVYALLDAIDRGCIDEAVSIFLHRPYPAGSDQVVNRDLDAGYLRSPRERVLSRRQPEFTTVRPNYILLTYSITTPCILVSLASV